MNHPTVTLGSIAKITSGGTPDRRNLTHWGGTIPWVKTAQIQNRRILLSDVDEYITSSGLDESSTRIVPAGTILMAMYGQGKTRGQVAVLGVDAAINQACAAIHIDGRANRDYVYQQLLFRYDSIRALSNTGSQENLNAGLVREIAFPLPPLSIQERVAEVLCTWDSAIEKVHDLIAIRERRRQAVTELLYGIGSTHGSLTPFGALLREAALVPVSARRRSHKLSVRLYGKGVVSKDQRRDGSDRTQYFARTAGHLIYSTLDFLNGAFGLIPAELDGYESTLDLPTFEIATSVNPHWLLGYLTRPAYYRHQQSLARGQRKARRVRPSDFLASALSVPPRPLQDRIAATLEMAHLELRSSVDLLCSLRTQKQGLMQELLENRERSPVPTHSALSDYE